MENLEMKNLLNIFRDKRVLITGHTGFKGSWMSKVLLMLGANVSGISLSPHKNSLYNMLNLDKMIDSHIADIRDLDLLKHIIEDINPQIVFHLAAQPIVLESYNNPIYTFDTNVMGSINLMESLRNLKDIQCIVMITTDKVYENKEWVWGYRENDALGGHDPYSASKACVEIAISSYRKSFFNDISIPIVSVRAGNVIGGGDFSNDRIIPDIVRSIKNNMSVKLRNPTSVRPWQHVLDVIYGYLLVAYNIINKKVISDSYNFAPLDNGNKYTVEYITNIFINYIGKGNYTIFEDIKINKEMNMLRLDSSLARKELNWEEIFTTDIAIEKTAEWYRQWLEDCNNSYIITEKQIEEYFNLL